MRHTTVIECLALSVECLVRFVCRTHEDVEGTRPRDANSGFEDRDGDRVFVVKRGALRGLESALWTVCAAAAAEAAAERGDFAAPRWHRPRLSGEALWALGDSGAGFCEVARANRGRRRELWWFLVPLQRIIWALKRAGRCRVAVSPDFLELYTRLRERLLALPERRAVEKMLRHVEISTVATHFAALPELNPRPRGAADSDADSDVDTDVDMDATDLKRLCVQLEDVVRHGGPSRSTLYVLQRVHRGFLCDLPEILSQDMDFPPAKRKVGWTDGEMMLQDELAGLSTQALCVTRHCMECLSWALRDCEIGYWSIFRHAVRSFGTTLDSKDGEAAKACMARLRAACPRDRFAELLTAALPRSVQAAQHTLQDLAAFVRSLRPLKCGARCSALHPAR